MLRHGRGESGATIMEIVVGLAVGALLVAGVLTLIEQIQKTYMHSSEAADLQQNVRVGMDRVTRLIQAAGMNPKNLPWGGATASSVVTTTSPPGVNTGSSLTGSTVMVTVEVAELASPSLAW